MYSAFFFCFKNVTKSSFCSQDWMVRSAIHIPSQKVQNKTLSTSILVMTVDLKVTLLPYSFSLRQKQPRMAQR
jgi:hypothetical protein